MLLPLGRGREEAVDLLGGLGDLVLVPAGAVPRGRAGRREEERELRARGPVGERHVGQGDDGRVREDREALVLEEPEALVRPVADLAEEGREGVLAVVRAQVVVVRRLVVVLLRVDCATTRERTVVDDRTIVNTQ